MNAAMSDMPALRASRTQLESVIHNLLSNSRDAFATSGTESKRISIACEFLESERMVRMEYRDNAGGISQEVMSRIFEPFFTTKGGEGTGLGLAISSKIIADHGGSIHCESQDGETRFRILLPAFSAAAETRQPAASSA